MTNANITITETSNRFGFGSTFKAYVNGKFTKYKASTREDAERHARRIADGISKYGKKFIW